MARQKGIIKLKGKIGDLSFYKTKDGYLAREKGGIDKERMKNDPAFQRTRENGAEFGRAGKAGRLLRTSVRPLLLKAADGRVASRMTREMVKVVKSDTSNDRGQRTASEGDVELLKGFEFNQNGKLNATMYAPFSAAIDRASGEATVNIPGFIPQNTFAAPGGATHMRLIVAASKVDFEGESFDLDTDESSDIAIGPQSESAINLTATVPTTGDFPIFLLFGVEFLQEVNGTMYPLKNGAYNALALVEIDNTIPGPL
ncbi:hypothetical protein MATR_29980 [Marivirga tractuosa]|uniref:Uncharacterized protein n=1 Tax=Marivirga tractuosa (strain ATCC 23168 / DSM 4126 / NBRC 15989 / NCIMB 1408 / VKM B-1430 / H-43) TaxID=643867 RepID=E4TV88_MARTH|nr:hypothetical protein [Marivirga tractuosa]ADR23153.1 hypothetical protein Ftrac_3178 [Marivirga tractuosa DSM 4126]BDD16173.1 hypothetical protein MATR_29980 [Marivirga tractuosa]